MKEYVMGAIYLDNRRGQAMLLTAVAMGGTLLVVSTVAGLITLYQLRQTSNVSNSAKAIYAADTGMEWGIYQFERYQNATDPLNPFIPEGKEPPTPFSNGAVYITRCYDENGAIVNTTTTIAIGSLPVSPFTACDDESTVTIRSIGRDSGVSRSLQLSITILRSGP